MAELDAEPLLHPLTLFHLTGDPESPEARRFFPLIPRLCDGKSCRSAVCAMHSEKAIDAAIGTFLQQTDKFKVPPALDMPKADADLVRQVLEDSPQLVKIVRSALEREELGQLLIEVNEAGDEAKAWWHTSLPELRPYVEQYYKLPAQAGASALIATIFRKGCAVSTGLHLTPWLQAASSKELNSE